MEKTSGGAVRFAGYASVFDHADRSGDIVRKGAFARAVAAGPKGVPLLWQHDPKRPIGRIERIEEDARGLRVIGRLSGASGPGRDAAALLKDGAINGLRSEEHTSELQSLMRISYAVFRLKKKKTYDQH